MDDKTIEEAIKEANKHIARELFSLDIPQDDYAGTYDGAWIVMYRMKQEDPLARVRFYETIQALATKAAGIPSGVLSLGDSLFYTTPLTICLAALSVIMEKNTPKGDNVIQLRRKDK